MTARRILTALAVALLAVVAADAAFIAAVETARKEGR